MPKSNHLSKILLSLMTEPTTSASASASGVDSWLASFSFTKLPLELQLYIGGFTVEHGNNIEFYLNSQGQFRISIENCTCTSCYLALPHTCHAFHKPLVRHFFKANSFKLYPNPEGFDWLLRSLGQENIVSIQALRVVCWPFKDQFTISADIFPGLRYLTFAELIRIEEKGEEEAEVEQTRLSYRNLFQLLPQLHTIEFSPMRYLIGRQNKRLHITDLTLTPGACGRGIEDVVVKREEIQVAEFDADTDRNMLRDYLHFGSEVRPYREFLPFSVIAIGPRGLKRSFHEWCQTLTENSN